MSSYALHSLSRLPSFTGCNTFFGTMNRSGLSVENEEIPIPGRCLRTIIRIIFTAIALPFFNAMGAVYNLCLTGSSFFLATASLFGPDEWRLDSPCFFIKKGINHFMLTTLDISSVLALPITVMAHSFQPTATIEIYANMTKWMTKKIMTFGEEETTPQRTAPPLRRPVQRRTAPAPQPQTGAPRGNGTNSLPH